MSLARTDLTLTVLWLAWLSSPSLGQSGPRELRGELFSVENGDQAPKLLPGVQVTLREYGNSDVTNDSGLFRIPLPVGAQPGQEVTLRQDRKGYVICAPLYGKQILPAEGKLVEVRMLPEGSKLFWTHERIEEFIARTASDAAKQPKGPEAKETDLSSYIDELGKTYGFTPEQVRAEIGKWMEQARKDATDFRKQGMVAFAERNFRLAAENFLRSAEGRQRQAAQSLLEVAKDRVLAGDSFASALDFRSALAEYEKASRSLAAYRDQLGALGAEVYPQYAADARSVIFRALHMKSEIGTRIAGLDGRRYLDETASGLRTLIAETPRSLDPQGWAWAQNNLAIALRTLGERQAGAEGARSLAEAVSASNAALEVHARDSFPQEWAAAQNNLSAVLCALGARQVGEEGTRSLTKAVAACRAALKVLNRDAAPQLWAKTQINLSIALTALGRRQAGAEGERLLTEAVAAENAALEVYTRKAFPQDWAKSKLNLGTALAALGERQTGAEGEQSLTEAVAAEIAALEVFTRDTLPQYWATTQNGLGATLTSLGRRQVGEEGKGSLAKAATALRAAREVRTREALPLDWAVTQTNLYAALWWLVERQAGPEKERSLAEALELSRELLEAAEGRARVDPRDLLAQKELSAALYRFGGVSEQLGKLEQARSFYDRAFPVGESVIEAAPTDVDARSNIALIYTGLSRIYRRLGKGQAAVDSAQRAIEQARAARELSTKQGRPFEWDSSNSYRTLGRAFVSSGRPKEAVRAYEEGLRGDPKSLALLNSLAWLLATSWDSAVRDGDRAVELAREACKLTEFKDPSYFDTLAAAYAEAGKFTEAVAWQKKALDHPEKYPMEDVEGMPAKLKLYEAGKPFHAPRLGPTPTPGDLRPAQ
jgi:tetratricopeptide (TPR) repeat protein